MYKKDIKINDIVYWNTRGAYDTKISLKCRVIDIGKRWIWIHVAGNLSYTNLLAENLSKEPLHRVTNANSRYEV